MLAVVAEQVNEVDAVIFLVELAEAEAVTRSRSPSVMRRTTMTASTPAASPEGSSRPSSGAWQASVRNIK